MANNLTDQVRSISEVTKAVALGDLSKQVQVDVQGEMLDLKMTVNSMVNQLSTLANEVTRVSLEVGTEGILGGQAFVPDVQGMWKVRRVFVSSLFYIRMRAPRTLQVLADNVNLMAMNLTNQVRSIDEVTRVAREVGTEGRLGGQAKVTNVGGTWKVSSSCIPALLPFPLGTNPFSS